MFPWPEQSGPRELSRPAIVDAKDDNLDKDRQRSLSARRFVAHDLIDKSVSSWRDWRAVVDVVQEQAGYTVANLWGGRRLK
jgi:hypothetical protein